jgi:AraC-like DNA-binding protein
MSEEIFQIKSITQMHNLLGLEKPKHPLITVIKNHDFKAPKEMLGMRLSAHFYGISLKGAHCGVTYGRKHYDFEEGVLVFHQPDEVATITDDINDPDEAGWSLFFHPDLIRTSPLGGYIDDYTFFHYNSHESLHLSDDEKKVLMDCLTKIIDEYEQRIDNHSQRVIVSNLELMLNYCSRFYERQFNTRSAQNQDIANKVKELLRNYFQNEEQTANGLPSIQYVADNVHLSPNYLSDLLKKETGRSTKDYINDFLVEKAKRLLLNSNDTVSSIAYHLGFNYPHYFSRLFKAKTGVSPNAYREVN